MFDIVVLGILIHNTLSCGGYSDTGFLKGGGGGGDKSVWWIEEGPA